MIIGAFRSSTYLNESSTATCFPHQKNSNYGKYKKLTESDPHVDYVSTTSEYFMIDPG